MLLVYGWPASPSWFKLAVHIQMYCTWLPDQFAAWGTTYRKLQVGVLSWARTRVVGSCLKRHWRNLLFPWTLHLFPFNSSSVCHSFAGGNATYQISAPVTLIKHQKYLPLVWVWVFTVIGVCRVSTLVEKTPTVIDKWGDSTSSTTTRRGKSSHVLKASCSQVATESQDISLTC